MKWLAVAWLLAAGCVSPSTREIPAFPDDPPRMDNGEVIPWPNDRESVPLKPVRPI